MMINSFCIYALALAIGGAGALAVAVFGKKWALLDRPNQRSSHERPVPRGGGIGILAAFVVCSLVCAVPAGFWIPALILALISFVEDRFEIRVSIRLLAQFFLALCFVLFCVGIDSSGFSWAAWLAFYLLFIVGTANFYNFMDGINGIAGIMGMAAFGLLGAYGLVHDKPAPLIAVSFVMVCACAGFLPFNVPRARVFLGDVGSILLGFVFAGLVALYAGTVTEFLVLSGFLFLFYADELVSLVERLQDGESPARAHRRHLYQVLANEGQIPHWRVSLAYGLLQSVIGVAAWKTANSGLPLLLVLLILFFVLFVLVNNKIKHRFAAGDM